MLDRPNLVQQRAGRLAQVAGDMAQFGQAVAKQCSHGRRQCASFVSSTADAELGEALGMATLSQPEDEVLSWASIAATPAHPDHRSNRPNAQSVIEDVQRAVQMHARAGAHQQAKQVAQQCLSIATAAGNATYPSGVGAQELQACLATDVGLVLDAHKKVRLTESGSDAIFRLVEPLVMKILLSAMSAMLIVDKMANASSLPSSQDELLAACIEIGQAVWSLFPLPQPRLIRLLNSLDRDASSGAVLTAPLYGYALSESSAETSTASGMSTCTLEGYARYEPSPRAHDASVPVTTGVLQWPFRIVPGAWVSTLARYAARLDNYPDGTPRYNMDETEAYMASALFQPWPFRNFNFLIDDDARSDDPYHITNCRKTFVTLTSAFPYRVDPKLDPKCRQQCEMHIPDYSTDGFLGLGQPVTAACPREFVKSLGVDAMPGVDMHAFGGMGSVARHLECVGCFDEAMHKSCDVQRTLNRNGGIGKSQLANRSAHAFAFELTAEMCERWATQPSQSIGEVYASMHPEGRSGAGASGGSVEWLKNLTHASHAGRAVWNPCLSRRWQRPYPPERITDFSPDPKVRMRVSGVEAKTSAAFGGRWPSLEIRDRNPDGVFEWAPLRVSALLVNVQREWLVLQTKILSGGSARRELDLEFLVDGVPVTPSNESWWNFDNKIEYVNPTALSLHSFGIVLLAGHDSFRVFALITLPVFYLNMHGRRRKMPGLVASGVGMMGLLLLLWYQGFILRNSIRPVTQTPHKFTFDNDWEAHRLRPMVVFGKHDLAAVFNFENATPVQVIAQMGSLILVSLPLYLGFLSLLLRWLFIGFLQPVFPKQMARLVRLVTRAASGAVKNAAPDPASSSTSAAPSAAYTPPSLPPGSEPATKAATKAGAEGNSVQHDVMNGAPPGLRAVVSLGSPEPGYWFESDYHKRKRCARNHVRILLRGKVWYEAQLLAVRKVKTPMRKRVVAVIGRGLAALKSLVGRVQKRKGAPATEVASRPSVDSESFSAVETVSAPSSPPPSPPSPSSSIDRGESDDAVRQDHTISFRDRRAPLEGPESFFFPLRLKMACALSVWICFMLTLIFYNLLDWAISVLSMAGTLEHATRAMRLHTDQLHHITHLGNGPVLMMTALSILGATITPEKPTYQTMIYGFSVVGCTLIFGCIVYQWRAIFRSFRQHSFRLRRGDYFFDRAAFREEVANKYIGYQVSHSASCYQPPSQARTPTNTLLPLPISPGQARDDDQDRDRGARSSVPVQPVFCVVLQDTLRRGSRAVHDCAKFLPLDVPSPWQ